MNKLGQMTLTEAIASLPAERREKIEQRAAELIEAEKRKGTRTPSVNPNGEGTAF